MQWRVLQAFRYSGRDLKVGDILEADDTQEIRTNVIIGRLEKHDAAAPMRTADVTSIIDAPRRGRPPSRAR